jgi:hypothetical protein
VPEIEAGSLPWAFAKRATPSQLPNNNKPAIAPRPALDRNKGDELEKRARIRANPQLPRIREIISPSLGVNWCCREKRKEAGA